MYKHQHSLHEIAKLQLSQACFFLHYLVFLYRTELNKTTKQNKKTPHKLNKSPQLTFVQHSISRLVATQWLLGQVLVALRQTLQLSKPAATHNFHNNPESSTSALPIYVQSQPLTVTHNLHNNPESGTSALPTYVQSQPLTVTHNLRNNTESGTSALLTNVQSQPLTVTHYLQNNPESSTSPLPIYIHI